MSKKILQMSGFTGAKLRTALAYGRALNRKNELFEQRKAAMGERPKYEAHTLPGGSKYRELLLTLPQQVPTHEFVSIEQMYKFLNNNPRDDLNDMSDLEKFKVLNKERRKPGVQPVPFVGSHYNQYNILAHVRFNERVDADGKRVLFIEEVQSDFGQSYRKQKEAIGKAVDTDFEGIVKRMEAAGVLEIDCD